MARVLKTAYQACLPSRLVTSHGDFSIHCIAPHSFHKPAYPMVHPVCSPVHPDMHMQTSIHLPIHPPFQPASHLSIDPACIHLFIQFTTSSHSLIKPLSIHLNPWFCLPTHPSIPLFIHPFILPLIHIPIAHLFPTFSPFLPSFLSSIIPSSLPSSLPSFFPSSLSPSLSYFFSLPPNFLFIHPTLNEHVLHRRQHWAIKRGLSLSSAFQINT